MKNYKIIIPATLACLTAVTQPAFAREMDHLKEEIEAIHAELKSIKRDGNLTTKDNINVNISGHINRAIQYASDGSKSYTNLVDSDNSSTRFKITVDTPVNDLVSIGAAIEMQAESNSTFNMNQLNSENSGGSGTATFTERRLEVILTHKELGRIMLGQGWSASDGTAESDLSDTWLAASSYQGNSAGFFFRDKSGNIASDAANDGTSDSVYYLADSFDGLSRTDRIRYDTPSFGGLTVATSLAQGDRWDLAAKYKGKIANTLIQAALGYADASGNPNSNYNSTLSGSVSVKFNNGFNLTSALGKKDLRSKSTLAINGADPKFYYTKAGYQAKLNSLGKTSFSIDYIKGDEQQQANEELTGYGFQAVQSIQDFDTDLYLALSHYERTSSSINYQDLNTVMLGARVKF